MTLVLHLMHSEHIPEELKLFHVLLRYCMLGNAVSGTIEEAS
jgi:hypothetical protein